MFAILFPEFKRNNEWLKEIFFRMRTQLQNSFHNDGIHIETSPTYHGHELEVWFDFITLVELNKIEDPWKPQTSLPTYKELIVPKALALMHMYKPNGTLPQVSDTDEDDERELLLRIGEYWKVPERNVVALKTV